MLRLLINVLINIHLFSIIKFNTIKITTITIIIIHLIKFIQCDWESWWTYEGISGPDFWGRLNPRWSHCSKGQKQSPIDIDTTKLLYDPYLESIQINGEYIHGQLVNTGRGISLLINQRSSTSLSSSSTTTTMNNDKQIIITGGPFSYQYTISNITLHFGRENDRGSEHTIDGKRFPGELQLYAYNSQLYSNWSEAKREPNGLIAISIFIMITGQQQSILNQQQQQQQSQQQQYQQQQPNIGLKYITNLLKNITKRGLYVNIDSLSINDLLPITWKNYITYDGSLTQPSCYETVKWVILNNPIYLSSYQFHMLRHSLKGDGHQDNFRPTQSLNKRLIRCNIINDKFKNNYQQKHEKFILKNNFNNNKSNNEFNYKINNFDDVENVNNDDDDNKNNKQQKKQINKNLLLAIKDTKYCLPNQIRLYGYKANTRIIPDEL